MVTQYISISSVVSLVFLIYVANTVWSLIEVFIPPECNVGEKCFTSYLHSDPTLNLVIFTSVKEIPNLDGSKLESVNKVHVSKNFDYRSTNTIDLTLNIPAKTRNNGTLYMHAALLESRSMYKEFGEIRQTESIHTFPLVKYMEPQATTFNLLENNENYEAKTIIEHVNAYSHLATAVPLGVLTDNLNIPGKRIPPELYPLLRIRKNSFLPIIQYNIFKSRMSDYQLLNKTSHEMNVTVTVSPICYGLLRLAVHIRLAMEHLSSLGFSEKDIDDVKEIFADTNLYLLSGTIMIATCHLLFDFLAFKNDVSFWRQKRSMAGLSARTVVWRAFSQLVIFFYLADEQTSLLVLIPAGVSSLIEIWKVSKVLPVRVRMSGWRVRLEHVAANAAEERTARADREAMRYLCALLYPLCAAGALYTLLYHQHKSWYSWALHSVVNGVYAFGFLLMLPQLFVNYRLRSVAALPWRAFMYKAFNTFIDDVFAFVITMPTAHRVACFRDDLVFLVYLYQRWLYPVDKSRVDTAASMDENPEESDPLKKKED